MSKIVGNYELTIKLGSGSYASVFKCIHTKSGEPYAIKAISKEKVGDPKLMENLVQEISIMRDYLHPNIVQLFEHFSSSRYIYLVLELCPGGDLSKFIKKFHRIDEIVAQGFLRQLSEGLHFLQEKSVIHRDLKPANVLLSESSNFAVLKIADFGFAKHLVEASMAQTPCGSPLYMAPEIFEMQEYDAKADIWSVGCVFYEMLVGAPPFKGSNPRDLFQNIRTKPLQIPSEVVVGPQSVALLKKLLERNPRRRASMDQFCAACTSLPITRTSLAVREEKAKAAVQTNLDNDQKATFAGAGAGTGVGEDSPLNGGYDERSGALGGADPGPSIPQPAQPSSSAFTPAHSIGGNAGNASSVDPPTHWSTCDLSNNREQDQQNGQFNDPHSSQHQSQHHTQQQQHQQQQQNYRWSESAGEPLSRRHSVDSSPKNIHDGRNYSPSGAGPDRSGYGNMSVKDSMMSNQNMSASTMNQQHRPSMASSLFAEGISRVMDFLSKSPSQKSSPTALQQQRSESAKTQSFSTQHLHAYGARNRANSYNDTETRSRTNFFAPGSGFDGSDSSRNVPGNASSGHIQSSSGARRQGYHQNNGGIDDYRRAPMASIEEKDGSKGMRLSESDEGFVLVDPTPLPAAPHPWRGNGGGTSVLSGKHNYSSSGRPQNAIHNTNSPGNGTGTGAGAAWAEGPGRDQYDTANQKSPSQRSAQPGQQMQAMQGSQYHLQAQQSTPDTQHNRTSSASSSTKEKDKDRDRDRDRDRPSRSELSLPQFNENEKFAIAGMTQRSEYVCQVVMSIVRVGDCMAKEILVIEKKKDFFAAASVSGVKGKGLGEGSRVLRPQGDSSEGQSATLAGVCALYLHCVALLKDTLEQVSSLSANPKGPKIHPMDATNNNLNSNLSSNPNQIAIERLQKGLLLLFDQVLSRVDQCYKRLLVHSTPSVNPALNGATSYNKSHSLQISASPTAHSPQWGHLNTPPIHGGTPMPSPGPAGSPGRITAEPLMYRAALQLARDASVEELLGNLQTACDHYTSARLLVEGVMMTACEPQDRETLHQFAMSFTDRLAHCRQLLESHDLLLPPSIVSIKSPPPQLFSSMSIRAATSTSAPSTPNFCIPHPSLHQSQGQGQGLGQGLGQGQGQGQGQGRDVSSSSRASPGDHSMMRHFGHDPIVGPL